MRAAGRVFSILGIVLSLLVAVNVPSHADTLSAVSAPIITLQKSGTTFSLTPATWSAPTKSTIAWLVNGKLIPGANKKNFTAPNKKGSVVQARETANGIVQNSNKITIGSVAVNGLLNIAFSDSTHTSLVAVLPPTFPTKSVATYQWFQEAFEIKGAHSPTYTLATGDQGREISLKVFFASKGLVTSSALSNSISIPV